MPFPMVNYPAVPHTWVLVYRVKQRSHVTKIIEVKRNLTQFIGGKFNHNIISIVIGSCTSGIKTPNLPWALCLIFLTYQWKFTTGKLPWEMSVTRTKWSFHGKRVIYLDKSAPCNRT